MLLILAGAGVKYFMLLFVCLQNPVDVSHFTSG